jgi:hypothetical protein
MASVWFDVNRSIENHRKETEKAFSTFLITLTPKMNYTSWDILMK